MTSEANSALERLGRYEVLGEIASGGMATVFLGRVTGAKGFQRLVAIKRLHPHLESEEEFVTMFLDEARLAARIRHPNVVATLDVEDQNGLYIVMEYIEGDRLLGLLRHAAKTNERIPIPVAIRIALDTLAGLHAAHELTDEDGEHLGLVHRDVSPQNILIGVDGVSRLTDFGIAKATARLTVTRDGQLKGKIAYMAPEQTKRVEIDRRVDVFAMGIITWEMFTSKKLFQGESDVEVLNSLLFEPIPRLKESAPGIPAAIDQAVMKALDRDPTKRYTTASEFAEALERASKILGGPANARTVATHLQKVSADKLAKDRARSTGGEGPTNSRVRRVTNSNVAMHETIATSETPAPAPDPGSSQRLPIRRTTGSMPAASNPPPLPARKSTLVGVPVAGAPPPPPLPPAAKPAAPQAPAVQPGPALVDDDEDVPTSAHYRDSKMLEAVATPLPLTKPTSHPPEPLQRTSSTNLPVATGPAPMAHVAIGPPLPPGTASPNEKTSLMPEPAEPAPASSGARKALMAVLVLALGIGIGVTIWLVGNHPRPPPVAPRHVTHAEAPAPVVATPPPALPAPPIAPEPTVAPTQAAPPPTPPAQAAAPTPPPAQAAAPTPPAQAATPTPAPTTAEAHPTPAPSESEPSHGHSHSHHASHESAPASSSTQSSGTAQPAHASTSTTSTSSSTSSGSSAGGANTTQPAPQHTHEDDPFGSDNPYQR